MEYSFPRYLLSKQSVDDRALNRHVFDALKSALSVSPRLSVVEVGAGIGTMLVRLLRWGLLKGVEYTLVDEMPENIDYAAAWIPLWAAEHGLRVEKSAPHHFRLLDDARDVCVNLECADVFGFVKKKPQKSDLLIAHAFLDLLPMPASLEKLFSLLNPGGLAWLTVNFDGVTTLEPAIDPLLDAKIEHLYHHSMDIRPTGGDSRSGRHLFGHLRSVGAEILAAGASDWVVHAIDGKYPADEAYFLYFILHFFENALCDHPELDGEVLQSWLAERRRQIECGDLVYIAHQIDFLARLG
jgi:SAM-dependent methyltransferase